MKQFLILKVITKEVKQYLAFLEEDMEEEYFSETKASNAKISKDEAENTLIQAVLKEIFP